MKYDYNNISESPNLSGVHADVATSEMSNKNIEFCRWDEETEILAVHWVDALDVSDKTILDGIVADNS